MKSRYLYFVLAAAFIATSCNKKLDVHPQDAIQVNDIKTEEDVKAVLMGDYALYQNFNGFGERLTFIPDLIASENQVNFVGTFTTYRQFQRKTQLASSSIAAGIWANMYRIILDANTVLDKLNLVTSNKNAVGGEAKFMRGVAYFELVNLYALPYSAGNVSANPGVPIVPAPVYAYDSAKNKPSRASVADVYAQVIKDLTDAAAVLPSSAPDEGRATKYAAKAFLARVYLMMGDYANAATAANDVIASGQYVLAGSFDKAFNNASPSAEDIFSILQTSQSNTGTSDNGLTTFYATYPTGRGDAQIDAGYPGFFDAADQRGLFSYDGYSIGGANGKYTTKYAQKYKSVPVIRLAEMYLTRGEANARAGTSVGNQPLVDINVVRSRSGASLLVSAVPQSFIDERFRELGFEGDRLWSLKRSRSNVNGLAYTANKLVLPIPQHEIDVNSNLRQNPGY